jgi:hypothetical protein
MEDFPLSFKAAATVLEGRKDCENIINRLDDRLIVVCCSLIPLLLSSSPLCQLILNLKLIRLSVHVQFMILKLH